MCPAKALTYPRFFRSEAEAETSAAAPCWAALPNPLYDVGALRRREPNFGVVGYGVGIGNQYEGYLSSDRVFDSLYESLTDTVFLKWRGNRKV